MEFGTYRAERRLADGPLGIFYEGMHRETQERVLLHRLPPVKDASRLIALLQDQARLLAQHQIPGVLTLVDIGQRGDGTVYLVTEFMGGETLAARLTRKVEDSLALGLHVSRQLARSLARAHQHGIAHLAVSPGQVLLTCERRALTDGVLLLGLGIAALLGSPGQPRDNRADVFALGALLAEILQPQGATLPMELTALVKQMTASAPPERPAMAEVASRLDAMAAGPQATVAKPAAAPGPLGTPTVVSSPRPPADPWVGALFGSFRIIRKIGEGGMGVVYEAEHQKIGRRAAVKLLHPNLAQDEEYAQRFLNEARAVNIIRHRGLVEIFEFGKLSDGTLFFVMEFLEGGSLYKRMEKRNSPFPEAEAVGIAVQIARALTAAHAKGIIHRDLKPANIMLESDPVRPELDWVKILDFGIAKVRGVQSAKADPRSTAMDTGVCAFMGTPMYMAPEQHGQAERVDGKADVFSLGVMLYELLSEKLPFQNNALELLYQAPTPLNRLNPEVSKRVALLVNQMLATKPAHRPTMQAVADQLVSVLPQSTVSRKRLVGLGGVAGLLVGALALLVVRFFGAPTPAQIRSRALERALEVVKQSLQDRDVNVRVAAVRALGQSRDLDHRGLLVALLQSKDASSVVVEEAARALGQVGAIDAQPVLIGLTETQLAPGIQIAAAGSLAQLQHPRGPEVLRRLLSEGDDYYKVHAALLLLERGDFSGAPLLWAGIERGALTDSNRVQVLGRLALSGDAKAKHRLSEDLTRLTTGEARVYIAYSLARAGEESGMSRLKQVAAAPGPDQLLALRLLAGLGEPEAGPQLLKLAMAHSQPDSVRELAMAGLADSVRDESLPVLTALAPVLAPGGASVRLRIAAAGSVLQLLAGERARLGEQSLSWARAALGSDSVATRALAVAVLGDINSEETIPPLGQALTDREEEIRKSAARALGHKHSRGALQALRASLDDADPEVRSAAVQSIGQVIKTLKQRGDPAAGQLVFAKVRLLATSSDERDRVVASGTLLQLGEEQPGQHAEMKSAFASMDARVRKLAVELSEPDNQAFTKLLGDADRAVRFAAARRLAAQGSRAGLPVLQDVVASGDSDGPVAYTMLRKLGEIVPPPLGLASLLSSGDLATRLAILEVISELPPADGQGLLQIALLDPVALIRRRVAEVAAGSYRKTRQIRYLYTLRGLLNDPDVIVRAQAATLAADLANLPTQASRPEGKPLPKPPESVSSVMPRDKAQPTLRTTGAVLFEGEELVRIQIDKGHSRPLTGKPVVLPSGPHKVSYLSGTQAVQVLPGQTVKVRIPVSLAEQLLQDGKDSLGRHDFQQSQETLDRVRRLLQRGQASSGLQSDLAYQQARLYESRGRFDDAITEYNRCLTVPADQRPVAVNTALQSTLVRLSARTGRIQLFTSIGGKCQLTRELLALPGQQVISLGKGQTRTVFAQVGSTTKVMACQ